MHYTSTPLSSLLLLPGVGPSLPPRSHPHHRRRALCDNTVKLEGGNTNHSGYLTLLGAGRGVVAVPDKAVRSGGTRQKTVVPNRNHK